MDATVYSAFLLGADAYWSNINPGSNPYEEGCVEYNDWADGYGYAYDTYLDSLKDQ
jgi:hypothetical protein